MFIKPRKLLGAGFNQLVKKVSRGYIAGATLDDAAQVCKILTRRNYWHTYGYWSRSSDQADKVLNIYQASLRQLGASASKSGQNYLSIKLPALNYDKKLFENLVALAGDLNIHLHLDSLAPSTVDQTFAFLKESTCSRGMRDYPICNLGCTLPGSWKRSIRDARKLAESDMSIRVVKGQWQDPNCPRLDVTRVFLNVVNELAGRSHCVRVATHDVFLANEALKVLYLAGTPCELELLYGLPVKKLVPIAEQYGIPIRVYVAFGNAFLPYALSSIRKHPETILMLLKEAIRFNYLASFPILASE